MSQDEIEARKKKAERGWLADPLPTTPESLPAHHIDKWRRMHGQLPPKNCHAVPPQAHQCPRPDRQRMKPT